MMMMQTDSPDAQRALLLQLDDLTSKQECALDAGDMAFLTELSEMRTKAVHSAAAYLPPRKSWDPDLMDLVAQVQERAEHLQHQIQACRVAIRRELATLDKKQHVVRYVADYRPAN